MSAGSGSSSSSSSEEEDEDEEPEPELEPLLPLLLLPLLLLEDLPRPRRLARPRFLDFCFCAAALRCLCALDRRLPPGFDISFFGVDA